MNHKREMSINCGASTKEVRGPSPMLGSPAQESCTRKTSPQSIWLWKSPGLTFGSPGGLGEIETPLLKGTKNLTHSGTQGRSSDLKGAWVRPACWSWRVSLRQAATAAPLGTQTQVVATSEESGLPCGHWSWQAPFWNPLSSLSASGPSPAPNPSAYRHQCRGVSGQATNWV